MVVNRNSRFIETSIWDGDRSALQTLHKVSAKARDQNYFQGGMTHGWVEYYESRIESDRSCLNEWHAMDNLESRRPASPDSIRTKPTEREETEKVIRSTLKEIMMSVDLDEVTSKVIRSRLEEELDMDLGEYKSFIDQEMLVILGQMDAPTEIFAHVYLGSEWNASNYEELQKNGVYDDEKTDLLKHWDDTFKYITKAKDKGSKVLVHCKMGVSRSASVVIAYAMKAYNWDFHTALTHVKEKRSCIKPNTNFLSQLETYQGILDAMKNKEKLQRSKSETNLKSPETNGKNEKVLAGSEPTPVVQVMSKSYDLEVTMSGQDLRHLGARPKSWSPDNVSARELVEGIKSSPIFMSLEDVSQKSSSKESVKSMQQSMDSKTSLARHVLMPCDNGESYSVSPNQIVHLPGHDAVSCRKTEKKKLILSLANRFENSDQKTDEEMCSVSNCDIGDTLQADEVKKETWDPGEKKESAVSYCSSTSDACDLKSSVSENQTVWTSTTTIKTECAVPLSCSNSLVKVPDVLSETVQTKSVTLRKDSDPFSNQLDRVFDREEKKQQRMSTIPVIPSGCNPELPNDEKIARECPSRQSSWSSYDSAVVLGFQNEVSELSRHSSWGSGDTRTLPSRNSSWGSYDMRPRGPVHYINEKGEKVTHGNTEAFENSSSGIFPYDKEDIPWHPGTVKRTKQKIEECSTKKPTSNDSMTSSCVSLVKTPSSETLLFDFIPEKERPAEAINTVLINSMTTKNDNLVSSAISEGIDIPNDDHKSSSISRLSISAPEPSSMELVSQECALSRSASNVSSMGKFPRDGSSSVISTAQCSSVKQHRTLLENLQNIQDSQYMIKKMDDLLDSSNSLGKVRNLKKEFEAKSSTNIEPSNVEGAEAAKSLKTNRVNSLPSSPISVHHSKEKKEDRKTVSGDDLNLKSLIGIFENKEEAQVNLRQKFNTTNKPFTQNRNTRYSCIEVSVEKSPVRITQTPLISNLNKNSSPVDKSDDKRPPIVPVVRNASPGYMVAATVIATAAKKQQQYGKSHPLARLNVKPRHNNPVYNTM
ncbi:hypothetical protein NQ318_000288 [Aromia moschata]|uniref:protein-serine/threonine phosphatase n=1 Tax=Aromia moschata TaxID=1265417 RepID=A0AAV8YUU5_9CUCU|nr:hypothetical protein NQ318_000288 [Aromia moschata]